MHIVLTNPWEAGSIDDGATYPHAKITGFAVGIGEDEHVTITVEFGAWTTDLVDVEGNPLPDAWVKGRVGRYNIRLDGPEFAVFLQSNASLFQALQTLLYETVQTKYPVKAAGAIT